MVLSLRGLEELRGIEASSDQVRVGAMTTLEELLSHEAVRQHFPALVTAAADIKSLQIRSMATLGGNLCQRPRCWYYRLGYGPAILGYADPRARCRHRCRPRG